MYKQSNVFLKSTYYIGNKIKFMIGIVYLKKLKSIRYLIVDIKVFIL